MIKVWEEESKPDDWKRSNMRPVCKRSDAIFVVIMHLRRFLMKF